MDKTGFVSWSLLLMITLIALAIGLALLYVLWGGGEGLTDILVQNLRGL